jgi:hypothetical protein
LNEDGADYFLNHPNSLCQKVTILSKFHYDLIRPVEENRRWTTRLVRAVEGEEFLLTALHLVSKRNSTSESLYPAAASVANELRQIEYLRQNDRHIVVGDFNMNPFETGMIAATGFHGTMSSNIALRGSRVVQQQIYPYFYNPTWNLFGDLNKDVSGTYYYKRAEQVCYEWNVFDQVLIRPMLIGNFVKTSLEIVQTDGVTSLLTKRDEPDKANYSDHLPLFFSLTF